MLSIQGKNIYIEHPDKTRDILQNINFNIDQHSKIGLIGQNGTGKTTLLKFLQGEYKNFKGDLSQKFQTKKKISTVVQEIKETNITFIDYLWKDHELSKIRKEIYQNSSSDISQDIQVYQDMGGYEYEIEIEKLIKSFGFYQDDLDKKISCFSGGEKTKISIIKALLENPELLLFDEPVNNLDTDSINWFTDYLRKLEKPFILISHERDILDNSIKTIWEIENNNINLYTGNYSQYKKQKEDNLENIRIKNENIDKHLSSLKNAITERKEKANSFENFKLKRSIKKNGGICRRDEGSGSARLSTKKIMKSAISLKNRHDNLLDQKEVIKKSQNIQMMLENNLSKAKNILNIDNLSLDFNYHSIKNISLTVNHNDKLNVIGKNGIGKSTFLKTLIGLNQNYSGDIIWNPQSKISYFSQNHDNLDFSKTVMEELILSTQKSETEIRNVLANLNLTDRKIFNKIGNLSLGERAKVIIAKIIISDSNVLVLDEPTNNLDIKSREALENALISFKGCIIFICHDLYLTNKIANKFLDISDFIKRDLN